MDRDWRSRLEMLSFARRDQEKKLSGYDASINRIGYPRSKKNQRDPFTAHLYYKNEGAASI